MMSLVDMAKRLLLILEPGQNLPYCPLKDHQTSKKKAKEVIQDIIDRD